MDGELDFDVRVGGRASKPLVLVKSRDLAPEDLRALSAPRGSSAPGVKELRASHHSIARCIATGMRPAEVSAVTGYSPSRISILQADPSFAELVEHYRSQGDAKFADVKDRMTDLLLDMTEVLQARIDSNPDDFKASELLDGIKTLADRAGFGPVTKTETKSVSISLAGRLEAARKRVA